MTSESLPCSTCKAHLPKEKFSKNQLKKKSARRCCECVELAEKAVTETRDKAVEVKPEQQKMISGKKPEKEQKMISDEPQKLEKQQRSDSEKKPEKEQKVISDEKKPGKELKPTSEKKPEKVKPRKLPMHSSMDHFSSSGSETEEMLSLDGVDSGDQRSPKNSHQEDFSGKTQSETKSTENKSTVESESHTEKDHVAEEKARRKEARLERKQRCKERLLEVFKSSPARLERAEATMRKYKLTALEKHIERKYGWEGDVAERIAKRKKFMAMVKEMLPHRVAKFAKMDYEEVEKALVLLEKVKQKGEAKDERKEKKQKKDDNKTKVLKKRKLDEEDEDKDKEDPKPAKKMARTETVSESKKKRKRQEMEAATTKTCDKCDGNHETDRCPHYKKARENHPDAQRRKKIVNLGGDGGNVTIRPNQARVHHQPGDGSCLYHSLRYGLGSQSGVKSTQELRRRLADWVRQNGDTKIADTRVREWVRWDAGCSVDAYAKRMRSSAWGGGIELAACSKHFNVRIHVWERSQGGFKRISCFDSKNPSRTLNVLYCGGVHYDFLEVFSNAISSSSSSKSPKTHHKGFSSLNVNKRHRKKGQFRRW